MSPSDAFEQGLRKACKSGDLISTQSLLDQFRRHLSPQPLSSSHLRQPLSIAIDAGQPTIVSYLLDQGASIDFSDITGAAEAGALSIPIFETFLAHGWDINLPTGRYSRPLKHVIDNEELVAWFLDHGADPNAPKSHIYDPMPHILDVAAVNASPAVFALLIARGAKIEDSDPLHSAAGEWEDVPGRVEMMNYLINKVELGVNEIEKTSKVPPSRQMGRGTPLHGAVWTGSKERVELLLKNGADPEIRNSLGETVLEWAERWELDEMVDFLKNWGKNQDHNPATALAGLTLNNPSRLG
ncbi:MAG: hypothetical protein Q9220_004347 [cf. Caloplaca sp. 1 TL-2023]